MTEAPEHDCVLCGILGGPNDDPWAGMTGNDHTALLAVATAAERQQISVAAAEHHEAEQVAKKAITAHEELHKRIDGELIQPIIARRKEADREQRLGETRARLLELLGQEGPGITLVGYDLETRLKAARQQADDAESAWQILHNYGVSVGLIDPMDEPPF